MRWRIEVLSEVFGQKPNSRLLVANRQYYRQHIADGSHIALVAEADGEDCGCGGVCFTEELPSPENRTGRCAYLMNIYVRKAFRNRGIAHLIVRQLMNFSKDRGCEKIYLETTNDGRQIYYDLGFMDLPDMMKYYEKH